MQGLYNTLSIILLFALVRRTFPQKNMSSDSWYLCRLFTLLVNIYRREGQGRCFKVNVHFDVVYVVQA